jgi:quinol monooxygenase YgiN
MNADARPGLSIKGDLGARIPAVLWIAIGLLLVGAIFLAGGGLLVARAVRGRRPDPAPATASVVETTTNEQEGSNTMFEATARLKIRDGGVEGFKQQVVEIVRLTRESDSQPLRYDWFISDDGTRCEVREAYEDADALVAQQQHVGPAKAKLFHDFVVGHEMAFYGELSPALAGLLEKMGVPYTQFSFLQGLETDVEVRDEVPA